ncbi:hypothetical protein EYF80_017184 [Liparis tanakae]|uniref:Uncharacterized protein n=1 Tax=Liparis tanakae TaxID=230148 RepID=A0A4Z2I3M0_9TELE|nr:hypothetical protein EYF80_017184 [Liparis tanakae]
MVLFVWTGSFRLLPVEPDHHGYHDPEPGLLPPPPCSPSLRAPPRPGGDGSARAATNLAAPNPTFFATNLSVSVPSAVAVSVCVDLMRWRPSSGDDGGVRDVTAALSCAALTPARTWSFGESVSAPTSAWLLMELGTCSILALGRDTRSGGGLGWSGRPGRRGSIRSSSLSPPCMKEGVKRTSSSSSNRSESRLGSVCRYRSNSRHVCKKQ